jgi:hypothetical protein
MKKINPKVTKLAVLLLSLLIAGGTAIAIQEGSGEPGVSGGGDDGTGT